MHVVDFLPSMLAVDEKVHRIALLVDACIEGAGPVKRAHSDDIADLCWLQAGHVALHAR